jgi:beta-glucanase (GH16 family)
VTWYFDDHPLHTEPTPEVFDRQDFFLVLTMQAGVNWRVGDLSGVDANRMKMDVDWVRVWQK